MTEYKIEKTIEIDASVQKVWDGLTNPDIIKQYMFGTETICDWKEGSEIIFQGSYEETSYKDKGVLQKIIAEEILQSTYLSSFSGLEDKPENPEALELLAPAVCNGSGRLQRRRQRHHRPA